MGGARPASSLTRSAAFVPSHVYLAPCPNVRQLLLTNHTKDREQILIALVRKGLQATLPSLCSGCVVRKAMVRYHPFPRGSNAPASVKPAFANFNRSFARFSPRHLGEDGLNRRTLSKEARVSLIHSGAAGETLCSVDVYV